MNRETIPFQKKRFSDAMIIGNDNFDFSNELLRLGWHFEKFRSFQTF